jgi:hypothetical protein
MEIHALNENTQKTWILYHWKLMMPHFVLKYSEQVAEVAQNLAPEKHNQVV